MNSFIFTRGASTVIGKNLCITVYELNGNDRPIYLDEIDVDTNAYKGDRAAAWKVISDMKEIPLLVGGYCLDTEIDIDLYEVGNYTL